MNGRLRRTLLALCLLGSLFAGGLGVGEAPLDRAAYRRAAEAVIEYLRQDDAAAADAIGRSVEQRGWSDGRRQHAADPAFTAQADRPEDRQAALRTVLSLLERTADADGPAMAADPLLLERLRAQPPAGDDDDPGLPEIPASWADFFAAFGHRVGQVLGWIADRLGDLRNWLLPHHAKGQGLDVTQVIVGLCLVLVAAIVCAVAILWWRRSRLVPAQPAPPRGQADEEAIDRPVSEWERRGDELLAAGDHRGALRAYFHAALAAAFAAGHLHHRRGRTNWEYIALVPKRSPWRADLVSLVVTFERSWYGGHATSAGECQGFRRAVVAVTEALRASANGQDR